MGSQPPVASSSSPKTLTWCDSRQAGTRPNPRMHRSCSMAFPYCCDTDRSTISVLESVEFGLEWSLVLDECPAFQCSVLRALQLAEVVYLLHRPQSKSKSDLPEDILLNIWTFRRSRRDGTASGEVKPYRGISNSSPSANYALDSLAAQPPYLLPKPVGLTHGTLCWTRVTFTRISQNQQG